VKFIHNISFNFVLRFEERWNFPNCIGAVDGKHCTIQKPKNTGSTYYNYKQRLSIILLAVCSSNYEFSMIDVGASGSNNDAGVWAQSEFSQGLENGKK